MADHPLTGKHAELHDLWLEPNGIVGWMPEGWNVFVNAAEGTVTWPKWRHLNAQSGPWDKDVMVASDLWQPGDGHNPSENEPNEPVVDKQVTPLAVPVTDQVRQLAKATGLRLIEA